MQIDLPNESSVQSKQNCCSLKVFFEFGSTHVPSCVYPADFDEDQYSQTTIDPLDMKDANILIDIINSEATSEVEELFWVNDNSSSAKDLVYETDVYDWPHQYHNFTPIFIEEFIMKTTCIDKVHCTRIALFQIYGTVFYWGRMYEDRNYKEGKWSLSQFHYFKLGFRHDVERFIDQYLKIFSLNSAEPVQCTSVRPNRLPHTITLYQQNKGVENRKRKAPRKDSASEILRPRRKKPSVPRIRRQPLKPKQAKARVTKPRVKKVKLDENVSESKVPNSMNILQEHHKTLSMEHVVSETPNDISEPLQNSGPTKPNVGHVVLNSGPNNPSVGHGALNSGPTNSNVGHGVLNSGPINPNEVEQYGHGVLNQPNYVQSTALNQIKVFSDVQLTKNNGLQPPHNMQDFKQTLNDQTKVTTNDLYEEYRQDTRNVQNEKMDLADLYSMQEICIKQEEVNNNVF